MNTMLFEVCLHWWRSKSMSQTIVFQTI